MKRILVPTVIISIIILAFFLAFPNLENYFSEVIDYHSDSSMIIFALLSFLILSSDFLLPIPSSILMFTNGLVLGFIPGFFLSIIANMVSSIFGYYLGRSAQNKVNSLYSPEELQRANTFLSNYGEIGLIISRGIPILSEATSIVSGNMSFNLKKFLLANFLGYIPVCALYAYLGSIAASKNIFLLALFLNIIFAGVFWLVKDFLLKKDNIASGK